MYKTSVNVPNEISGGIDANWSHGKQFIESA